MPSAGVSYDVAADLVASVGCPPFADALMRVSRVVIDADFCTLFAFPETRSPICLVATGRDSPNAAVRASRHYLSGHWRQDPLLALGRVDEGAVHHVASSEIADSYRRDCYDIPQIRDRLTLLFRQGATTLRMSFYRDAKRMSFGEGEAQRLQEAGRFFSEAAKRHLGLSRMFGVDASTGRPSLKLMEERLAATRCGLSRREIEVCGRILTGMTAEAIASDVEIGLASVITYRKRAYAKLGIASQNELFARCLVN